MPAQCSNPIPREKDLAFVPLALPKTGHDLLSGRQYVIDPVARAVIINEYGIQTPQIVECLHSQADEKDITIISVNKRTGESKTTHQVQPAREATFRAFFKFKRTAVFTLNLERVENLRQFYVDAPVEPDEKECSVRKQKGDSVAARKKVLLDDAMLAILSI